MRKVRCLVFIMCLLNAVTVLAMRSREEMGVKPIQKKSTATRVIPDSSAQDQEKSKALKPEETEPQEDKTPTTMPETGPKKPE